MASKAVNRPVDQKQKEVDVNAKLQLYGIYTAFANGKVPSNKQIDIAINSALASKLFAQPPSKLSPDGQKLVKDLTDVIEQAKLLVLIKNQGDLLQDFIWQCEQVTGGDISKPNAPINKDTAKQHGNEALEGLRTLGTLIISNGQFRKLLSDATVLLRDMAGDAALNTANRVKPTEDQLNQIDQPAEHNTWHDTPNVDNFKQNLRSKVPFGKKDVDKAVGDATQAAHPEDARDPTAAADLAAQDQQAGTASGVDAQGGALAGANTLKETADQNIPDEHKEKAKNKTTEYRERTREYLGSKMPKERRDQAIWRLKKMVVEVQGHQDYQQAVDTLLRIAEEYTGHTKTVGGQGVGSVKGAHTDNALQRAEADLKTLIERFANCTSSDGLFDSINQIYRDADQDPQLKEWFKKLDAYIRKCLKEQGFIMQDQATEEWNALYDEGNFLLRQKYRGHTDRIVDELKFLTNQFDADPQNKAFGNAIQKLFLDLGRDEDGKMTFKPHLLKDLQDVIIPTLFENVRYVPIPRIEYTDPTADAIIENLVIEGDNLAPNAVELSSDNYFRWGRKGFTKKNKNKVMLSASGIQMDIRDVSYYVKRKQGFPSITDKGVADIFMGGTGFSFKVEMESADKGNDRVHFFKVNSVKVDAKNLNIKIKKSNHKLLFGFAKPILLMAIKPALTKVLEKQIKDNANQLDAFLWDIHQEAKRAEADAKRDPSPENVQNIYQRYAAAINQRLMQGKQMKEKIEARKVNVAVTQHDSILPDISLPGGISSKATEYKELAAKGDKWESPIFSIGSAKETSSVPELPSIKRRSGKPGSGPTTTASTNGESVFANQVNQAFEGSNSNGGVNGSVDKHTTLGDHNPVLTGSAPQV